MSGKHVTQDLSAYCDGALSQAQSRSISEHLLRCPRCRREYDQVRLGVSLARQLAPVEAPSDLWADVESALRGPGPATRGTGRVTARRVAVAACMALAAGLAFLAFERQAGNPNAPPRPSLEVEALSGAPLVDSNPLAESGHLAEGSWLVTDASSRAEIRLRDIGAVHVDPNSRVRLVETDVDEQRLELARGRVSAMVLAPPRLFVIDTPSVTAVDLGCAYTLEVDDAGATLLHVTSGWVALAIDGRETEVPAGALCRTVPGRGTGTPYFEDASASFRAAVDLYDATADASSLRTALAEARARDTLTLWNLLPRVDGSERERLYARLAILAPPPKGVTRDKVIALDAHALNLWYDELEYVWY
jgi:hypothetical protein